MESTKSIPATRSDGTLIDGAMLRVCPFCSGEAQIASNDGADDGTYDEVGYFIATCTDCGAEGPAAETEIDACLAWNAPGDYQGGLKKTV